MALRNYLAIKPTNELNQNQKILELVEVLWKTILLGHCSVSIPACFQKTSFKFYNPAIVISRAVIVTSDRNTAITAIAIKKTSSFLLLSQA